MNRDKDINVHVYQWAGYVQKDGKIINSYFNIKKDIIWTYVQYNAPY